MNGYIKLYVFVVCIICFWFQFFELEAKDRFVVVIDAGHGGHDAGAPGIVSNEKDINLAVALKLGRLIENLQSDVKVIYTRKSDHFVVLQERANIANRAKANLFISIHCNSIDLKSKNRTQISGASTYTLGVNKTAENLAVAKRENSVILLEEDFSTRYEGFDPKSAESYIIFEFLQDKHMEQSVNFASSIQKEFKRSSRIDKGVRQASLLVLRATSMPAVLVELDFICNPQEERFMNSEEGQKRFAQSIYNAFLDYKSDYDRKQLARYDNNKPSSRGNAADTNQLLAKNEIVETRKSKEEKVVPIPENATTEIVYKIQIATSPKHLSKQSSAFKGLSPVESYKEGNLYKYTYGESTSRKTMQRQLIEVQKKIKGAFIVAFKDGKRL